MKSLLKQIFKVVVLYRFWPRKWKSITIPICLTNFIVQRILRVNASSPWSVNYTSCVRRPDRIKLGEGVDRYMAVSGHCYITGTNGVEIGDGSIFAPGVKILSANHDLEDYGKTDMTADPIRIGRRCWLGDNVDAPAKSPGLLRRGSRTSKVFICLVLSCFQG